MNSTGEGNPHGNIDKFRCREILAALLLMLARLPRSIFEYLYVLWMPGTFGVLPHGWLRFAFIVLASFIPRASQLVFTTMTNREV